MSTVPDASKPLGKEAATANSAGSSCQAEVVSTFQYSINCDLIVICSLNVVQELP